MINAYLKPIKGARKTNTTSLYKKHIHGISYIGWRILRRSLVKPKLDADGCDDYVDIDCFSVPVDVLTERGLKYIKSLREKMDG